MTTFILRELQYVFFVLNPIAFPLQVNTVNIMNTLSSKVDISSSKLHALRRKCSK